MLTQCEEEGREAIHLSCFLFNADMRSYYLPLIFGTTYVFLYVEAEAGSFDLTLSDWLRVRTGGEEAVGKALWIHVKLWRKRERMAPFPRQNIIRAGLSSLILVLLEYLRKHVNTSGVELSLDLDML